MSKVLCAAGKAPIGDQPQAGPRYEHYHPERNYELTSNRKSPDREPEGASLR